MRIMHLSIKELSANLAESWQGDFRAVERQLYFYVMEKSRRGVRGVPLLQIRLAVWRAKQSPAGWLDIRGCSFAYPVKYFMFFWVVSNRNNFEVHISLNNLQKKKTFNLFLTVLKRFLYQRLCIIF